MLILLALGLPTLGLAQAPSQLVHEEPYVSGVAYSVDVVYYRNSSSQPIRQSGVATVGLRHQIGGAPTTNPPWASWLIPPSGGVPYDVTMTQAFNFYGESSVLIFPGETLHVWALASRETAFQAWVGGNYGATAARQRDWIVYVGCDYEIK